MLASRNALLLFFVLSCALQSPPAKAETCQLDRADESIAFPDGKKIYFDFGAHVSAFDAGCSEPYNNPDLEISQLRKSLISCKRMNQQYLDTVTQRKKRISQILARDKRVGWGGLEFSQEEKAAFFSRERTDQLRLAERRLARKGMSETELRELHEFSAGVSGSLASWANQPSNRSKLDLVGLEKNELKIQAARSVDAMSSTDGSLKYDVRTGTLSEADYASLMKFSAQIFRDHKPPAHSQIESATRDLPEKSRAEAKRFLESAGALMALSNQREDEVVQNALSQSGSGIISFGSAHRDSMIRKFENACRQLDKSSSSVRPARSRSVR